MEGKINTHLFIMGLVTAILVSLITWLVFFNAFQNQVNADLKTDAQLIATSYDYITDDNDHDGIGNYIEKFILGK